MKSQSKLNITSVSILNETRRAMTTAAASWSNPAIKSYSTSKKIKKIQIKREDIFGKILKQLRQQQQLHSCELHKWQ